MQIAFTVEPRTYGTLISQRDGSTTKWYHFDRIGSTRLLSDSSETATDLYWYDAWGTPVVTIASATNPFRWIGKVGYYFDTETDLYYVRARVYAPRQARWTSRDPFMGLAESSGDSEGVNLYAYALNRPLKLTDPTGLCATSSSRPTYVGGRGWMRVWMSPYEEDEQKPDRRPRVGSGVFIRYQWPQGAFELPCCCCDKIGFVQMKAEKRSFFSTTPKVPTNWSIDGGVPYPKGDRPTTNPCSPLASTGIAMGDRPSAELYGLGLRLMYLHQRFITCAVCIGGGPEGLGYSPVMGPGGVHHHRRSRATVYDCVEWGHEISWDESSNSYEHRRWVNDFFTSGEGNVPEVPRDLFPGQAPPFSWWREFIRD